MAAQQINNIQQSFSSSTNAELLLASSAILISIVGAIFTHNKIKKHKKFKERLMKLIDKLMYKKNGKERKFKLGLFLLSLIILALTGVLVAAIGGLWGIVLGVVLLPIIVVMFSLSFSKK
jgi:amino acid permease